MVGAPSSNDACAAQLTCCFELFQIVRIVELIRSDELHRRKEQAPASIRCCAPAPLMEITDFSLGLAILMKDRQKF
jgi:hypothetical protein